MPPSAGPLLRPGQTVLGRYTVESTLGDGAMGTVYRASDTLLGRTVALKVLNPELWTSSKARQRMAREATALGRVNHPNVINIFNVFEHGEALILELEFVAGGALSQRLAQGPLPVPEAARIMQGVLGGLAAIHAAGIVHRDVKPSNILMSDDGTPKLADLGVAHDATAKGLTGTGATLGTVEYMSPEQIRGGKVGPRADVYACGVLLHQMVTGEVPFSSRSDFEVMGAHLTQEPDLTLLRSLAPPAIVDAVAIALAKQPEQRWETAEQFAAPVRKLAIKPESNAARTLTDASELTADQRAELRAVRSLDATPAPPLDRSSGYPLDRSSGYRLDRSSGYRLDRSSGYPRGSMTPHSGSGPGPYESGSGPGVDAGTIFSSFTPAESAKYGKCLPVLVGLAVITFLFVLLTTGALFIGVIQMRSGGSFWQLLP